MSYWDHHWIFLLLLEMELKSSMQILLKMQIWPLLKALLAVVMISGPIIYVGFFEVVRFMLHLLLWIENACIRDTSLGVCVTNLCQVVVATSHTCKPHVLTLGDAIKFFHFMCWRWWFGPLLEVVWLHIHPFIGGEFAPTQSLVDDGESTRTPTHPFVYVITTTFF